MDLHGSSFISKGLFWSPCISLDVHESPFGSIDAMDIHGSFFWIFLLDLHRYVHGYIFLDIHQFPWIHASSCMSMNHEISSTSIHLHGSPSMSINLSPCTSTSNVMDIQRPPWISMHLYGTPWAFTHLYSPSWTSMDRHQSLWIAMNIHRASAGVLETSQRRT